MTFTACNETQWRCETTPLCINKDEKCDGKEDCKDASDEKGCSK